MGFCLQPGALSAARAGAALLAAREEDGELRGRRGDARGSGAGLPGQRARSQQARGRAGASSSCRRRRRSQSGPSGTRSAAPLRGRERGGDPLAAAFGTAAPWEGTSGRLRVIFPPGKGSGECRLSGAPSLLGKTLTLWPGRGGGYQIRKDAFWIHPRSHQNDTRGEIAYFLRVFDLKNAMDCQTENSSNHWKLLRDSSKFTRIS